MTPDGLTPAQRWKRKLSDWVVCPACQRRWQRTNQQQQDGTVCCSMRCTGHLGNRGRVRRANRDAVVRYRSMIGATLELRGDQVRDVDVDDIIGLMLAARREGLTLGRQRGASRRRVRAVAA